MSANKHKKDAPRNVRIAILTVSTSRTMEDDKSGKWIAKAIAQNRHTLAVHKVVPDDIDIIKNQFLTIIEKFRPGALLVSGGTGVSHQDVTIEALRPFFEKELSAFGAVFAQLSYEQIDSAAILSRATAGIFKNTIIFCLPGSVKACKMACRSLIFPELGHLAKHIQE